MIPGPLDTPFYRFARAVLPVIWGILFRFTVIGSEKFPVRGPVVLASNHVSNLDPLFIGAAAPRQIHYMTKAEVWTVPLLGRAVSALGGFKVRRGQADRDAIRAGIGILDHGGVVGIFPEGHRQRSGKLGQPQPGVGLFSLRPGVLTVPVVITGSNRILRGWPPFPRVTVTFGAPLGPEAGLGDRSHRNRAMTNRIMRSLAAMLGQEWSEAWHE